MSGTMKRGVFLHIQTLGGTGVKDPDGRCPVTRKSQHLSHEHAVAFRAELIEYHGSAPGNIYQCPYCHHWHITRLKPPPIPTRGTS